MQPGYQAVTLSHLTICVRKRHIVEVWHTAVISELAKGETPLFPENPFEDIDAIHVLKLRRDQSTFR